jgi:plastocyanin
MRIDHRYLTTQRFALAVSVENRSHGGLEMHMRKLMMLGLVAFGCSCGGSDPQSGMNTPVTKPNPNPNPVPSPPPNPNPAPNPPPPPPPSPGPYVINISGSQISPATLSVKAGATVMVVNKDPDEHSLTSTAVDGSFTPGAVNGISFDTGPFHGSASFTVPASAPVGTVLPYFCTVQGSMMGTGTITIAAP